MLQEEFLFRENHILVFVVLFGRNRSFLVRYRNAWYSNHGDTKTRDLSPSITGKVRAYEKYITEELGQLYFRSARNKISLCEYRKRSLMRGRYAILVRLQPHRNCGCTRSYHDCDEWCLHERDRCAVGQVPGPLIVCSKCSKCSKSGDNTLKRNRTWSGGDATVSGRLGTGCFSNASVFSLEI
jgi:hypothetical protein